MGYANSKSYSMLEYAVRPEQVLTTWTTSTSYTINTITLPTWAAPLSYAYIDVYANQVSDDSGARNYLTQGYWGITDSGGTFRSGGTIYNGMCDTPANAWNHGLFCFPGYVDVHQYLESGMTTTAKLQSTAAHGTHLNLWDVFARIRMYFMEE